MNEITIEQAISCLQKRFGDGILDADTMRNIDMAKKIEQVRKMHPFAITPPKEESGRWQTYFKNSSGNRKCIKEFGHWNAGEACSDDRYCNR